MTIKKELVIYETERGKVPFADYLRKLKDFKGAAKIQGRLNRLMLGDYGDTRYLAQGISELKIDYGPGYRVYYAELKTQLVVVLLLAGTKRTQPQDIRKAIDFWELYKERYVEE